MTSLVAQALATAGKLEKATLEEEVGRLEERVDDCRTEIVHLIQQQYLDLFPNALFSARQLTAKINTLSSDVDAKMERIRTHLRNQENMTSKADIVKIQEKLRQTDMAIQSIAELAEIADILEEVELLSSEDHSLRLAHLLRTVDIKIRTLTDKAEAESSEESVGVGVVDVRAIPALREEMVIHKEKLIYDLLEWWGQKFQFLVQQEGCNRLKVTLSAGETTDANEKLTSLRVLGYLDPKMQHFGSCMFKHFFRPLVSTGGIFVAETSTVVGPTTHTLVFDTTESKRKKNTTELDIQIAEEILKVMGQMIDALNKIFGNIFVSDYQDTTGAATTKQVEEQKGDNSQGVSFLGYVGGLFGSEFLELIVSDILKPAIPYELSEMDKFDALMDVAKDLEAEMKQVGLLKEKVSLDKFMLDKESIFVDRRCQKLLGIARSLILKDLHNLVEVGEEKNEEDVLADLQENLKQTHGFKDKAGEGDETQSMKNIAEETKQKLPKIFKFPKCKISEPVLDLISLINETVDEASKTESRKVAARLYQTSRNMMELYVDLTPLRHNSQLKTIPQIAAVFYNSCYYLAHRLMTLGWEVSPQLCDVLGLPENSPQIGFVDYIPRLREMAAEFVEIHLKAKKDQLDDLLKDAQGFVVNIETDSRSIEICDKAMKGCVLQIQQIHRVWKEIFTPIVLQKSMGSLVMHFLVSVTKKIIALEDIGAQESNCLAEMLKNYMKPMEKVFMIEGVSEIHIYCGKSYFRYQEVVRCLEGSMQEIGDRWASGKGPLATYMSATDVKQMIRALFQNNDKRAALLARIK